MLSVPAGPRDYNNPEEEWRLFVVVIGWYAGVQNGKQGMVLGEVAM